MAERTCWLHCLLSTVSTGRACAREVLLISPWQRDSRYASERTKVIRWIMVTVCRTHVPLSRIGLSLASS